MRYRSQRYPANSELGIEYDGLQRRARLIDISPTGARLRGLPPIPADSRLTLSHLSRRIFARVAWSNEHYTGVEFATPLSAQDLDTLRGLVTGQGRSGHSSGHHGFREMR